MKTAMLFVALAGLATPALATISYSGGTYSENFNTLPSATVTGAFSNVVGTQAAVPGLTTWSGAKVAGTGTTATSFFAESGTGSSGALINYAPTADLTDRALGALASAANIMGFGVDIVNTGSSTLTDVTITFDREQYRSSTVTTNVLAFAYGFSGGSITGSTFLTDPSMTSLAAGNAVGMAFVASNGQLSPPNVAAVSFSITGLTWAPGQSLFIRWTDVNDAGNDAGIAIDNLTFTAVPTPGSLALLGLGGLVASRRRRA